MTEELRVRAARLEDAGALRRIQDAAVLATWPAHYDDAATRAWTLDARGLAEEHFHARMAVATELVAETPDGRVAGFGEIDTDNGELTLLYVDPDFMGRGVGSTLLRALEDAARDADVHALNLFASKNAVGFYERHGWRRSSVVEHRAGGHTIECVCMLRDLVG